MEKIRLGVVGTGLIWEYTHMPIINSMKDTYEVTALCVSKPEKREKWQNLYPLARIYLDYNELVRDENVDVVLVATPISLNHVVTIAALNAGKDVFEEKPIATNVCDANAVLAAEKANDKRVIMLEQLLYDPKLNYIQDLIKTKKLGKPVMFEMLTHFVLDPKDDPTVGYSKTKWRMNPDFPLGAIFDGGAHDFAVISTLFGIPKSLYSVGSELRPDMGKYDHILTSFAFEGSACGFHSHSAYLGGSNNYFNIRFSNGAVYSDDAGLYVEPRGEEKNLVPFEAIDLYANMWKSIAKVYSGECAPVFTAEQAAQSVRIFDAIVKSLDEDTSVSLT